MILEISLLILSIFLLSSGSDVFVDAVSRLAKRLGVSEFIIGLTMVAFATSLPELASTIVSAYQGHHGIIVGNVIGSNLANIGLILGLSAMISTLKVDTEVLKRDGYIMGFATLLFYIFALNKKISRLEAFFFILIYFAYILFLLKSKKLFKEYHFKEFFDYFLKFEYINTLYEITRPPVLPDRRIFLKTERQAESYVKKKMIKDGLLASASIVMVVVGANLLVSNSIWLASLIGIPQAFVGLTVVAIGTSLPELTVSLSAARKGFANMAVGNILGSNIANILLIMSVGSIVSPVEISVTNLVFVIPFLFFLSSLLMFFISLDGKIDRMKGSVLMILYIVFICISFIYGL